MKNNFFNNLGIASIERIHSQMIAWMFNEDFLSSRNKSYILNNLFDLNKNYKDFKAYTEYKNIDILIKADNDLFVVENKIKIGHHDNQLEKYQDIINKDDKFIKNRSEFAYLSLIGDDPRLEGWRSIKYQDLLIILKKIKFKNNQEFNNLAFNEYIICLDDLISVFNKFNNNHQDFFNVFTDGSKKKWEKIKLKEDGNYYKNEDQDYIADNQLETTFQRCFLFKIFKELKFKKKNVNWHVDESRGNALLHIDIEDDNYNQDFSFGLQFQDKTFKIVYAKKDYNTSNKNELDKDIIKIFNNYNLGFDFNLPKTKAYISISKKEEFDFSVRSLNDLMDNFYQKNIDEGIKIIKYLKKEYAKFQD